MSDESDKDNAGKPYKQGRIKIFQSFEEQEEYNLAYAASLTPLECLQHMRKWINLAYGMHGFDINNLPKKHSIRIIKE